MTNHLALDLHNIEAVVVGASAGGMKALECVLSTLPQDFPKPIMVVLHRSKSNKSLLEHIFDRKCKMKVPIVEDKMPILPGHIYFGPQDYHMLIEPDNTISLCVSEPVNYSRPAIDLLFESAAEVYSKNLLGIVLTGGNTDGSDGLLKIQQNGGKVIVQDPELSENTTMPRAAIEKTKTGSIMSLHGINETLQNIRL